MKSCRLHLQRSLGVAIAIIAILSSASMARADLIGFCARVLTGAKARVEGLASKPKPEAPPALVKLPNSLPPEARAALMSRALSARSIMDLAYIAVDLSQVTLVESDWVEVFEASLFRPVYPPLGDLAKRVRDRVAGLRKDIRSPENVRFYFYSIVDDMASKWLKQGPTLERIAELEKAGIFDRVEALRWRDRLQVRAERQKDEVLSPMQQNLIWEAEFNERKFRRTSMSLPVDVKEIDAGELVTDESRELPRWLKQLFMNANGTVNFPIHPMNMSRDVPFQDRPSAKTWTGFLTASRTMVFFEGQKAFAVKMPTDYTNPGQDMAPHKADMRKSVVISMNRSRHIEAIESKIGRDPRLIVLREVMAIYDHNGGNGLTVRDISPLLDGHLYLPSSALNDAGGPIADQRGESWNLWLENFARSQGRAQALLLIRYGLEMKFPHRQNTLQQLNADKSMTGNVVVRDMSDTRFVSEVASIIAPEALAHDRVNNYEITLEGRPNEQPLDACRSSCEKEHLMKLLEQAYYQTIAIELGLDPQALSRGVGSQPFFKEALRAYHQRLSQQAR